MKHKPFLVTHLLLFLFAMLPILSVLVAGLGSTIFGCENLHEGSAPDCTGGSLWYAFGVLGWLGLVTIPLGGGLLTVSLFVHSGYFLYHYVKK